MPVLLLVLVAAVLSGCESTQEKALDQAKAQAVKTGQAQQIVSVDKNGTTTTTVVQPPAAGQTNEAITTTQTPPAAGAPVPAFSEPAVSAVPQPVSVTIPAATVLRICRLIDLNEYKRKQAAPGLKITPLAFGVGRRIPIVQKYIS